MIGTRVDAGRRGAAALPLFHINALIVTLRRRCCAASVVWAGPLGYRDPALFKLLEARRALPDRGVVGRADPVRDAAECPWTRTSAFADAVVGAAPLPRAVVEPSSSAPGSICCEGYGLTEGTCASACQLPGVTRRARAARCRISRCARGVSSQPLAASADGRGGRGARRGPNVFAGYLVATPGARRRSGREVRDGWLNTGDLGSVDADGYVWHHRPRQGPDHPRRPQHRPAR